MGFWGQGLEENWAPPWEVQGAGVPAGSPQNPSQVPMDATGWLLGLPMDPLTKPQLPCGPFEGHFLLQMQKLCASHPSKVPSDLSHGTCPMGHVPLDMSLGTCPMGHVPWDMPHGTSHGTHSQQASQQASQHVFNVILWN